MSQSGIYQIKNNADGKVYIGQAQNIEVRWRAHRSDLSRGVHKNLHLQRAWDMYGENAFEWSVLEMCPVELLDERETFWIEQKDAFRNGYNRTLGGGGVRGYVQSEETRKKRSAALTKTMSNPEYKKARSEMSKAMWQCKEYRTQRAQSLASAMSKQSYKAAISKITKERWLNPDYRQNYINKIKAHFTDPEWKKRNDAIRIEVARRPDRREKIGLAHKRRFENNPELKLQYADMLAQRWQDVDYKEKTSAKISESHRKRAKPVLLVETGEVFDCLISAANHIETKDKPSICACCLGKRETAHGYHWRYADETEHEWQERRAKHLASFKPRQHFGHSPVPVLCVDTETVFPSCKSAAEFAGVDSSSISACCMGKQKTSGGYHWKYLD